MLSGRLTFYLTCCGLGKETQMLKKLLVDVLDILHNVRSSGCVWSGGLNLTGKFDSIRDRPVFFSN